MIEVTLPVSSLFSILEKYEKITFIPEQEQFLNSVLRIKNENGVWVDINAAITKKTSGRKVFFDSGDILHAANKHLVFDGKTCVFLDSLSVGDIITKFSGTVITVTDIQPSDEEIFYDLSVDSDSHLYQTANGIINHNTETAKLLAENLDCKLLKYDMSEFSEKHSVSSLIGPPPGYVGFSDSQVQGGRLISDLSKHPHAVLLFDEVEKAHPDIFNIFLQMLDEGRLTGSNGKEVSLKNCIIILTSNLGSADNERNNIGFGSQERTGEDDKALKEFFKPEFRNRLDLVCKFNKLDQLSLKKIVVKFLEDIKKPLMDKHNITLNLSEAAIEYLADKGYDPKMGARPLSRKIDELVRVPLAKKILFEKISNSNVMAVMEGDQIVFQATPKLVAVIGEGGIIEVQE